MFFANYKRSDYRTEGRVRNNIAQRYPIANPRDQLSGGTAILVSRQTSVVTKEQSASFGAIKIEFHRRRKGKEGRNLVRSFSASEVTDPVSQVTAQLLMTGNKKAQDPRRGQIPGPGCVSVAHVNQDICRWNYRQKREERGKIVPFYPYLVKRSEL
ncbi:uncharacterized protein LOC105695252 isoform X1 [Orussus abietinus]|uniref:uncharacterized protein LOC105695252 isoform X1 n=1 Tax=Orussus abietinus TaxID=222816 RepID=UPI0006259BFB|nr:uncharacterized protein LOC105695252 isoform X1 [Orussus abietinus]